MNSMDESNREMAVKVELQRRNMNPDSLRDSIHDLHNKMQKISEEMTLIKAMIEDRTSGEKKRKEKLA